MSRATKRRQIAAGGFTLVELLIVSLILGILAAIVIFAVRSVSDRGNESACATDAHTLDDAEEAHLAQSGAYTDEPGLVADRFLRQQSELYDIDYDAAAPQEYLLVVKDPSCGQVGTAPAKCKPGVTPVTNRQGHLTCRPASP
jgi:prepilin-type N-terminal cleavage/methylation domain-containing protein